uniref:Uncharacterized protein n=1 Tax=Arundo donax TaxID=35708 RepID=A0A0A8Z6K9_ARUDO
MMKGVARFLYHFERGWKQLGSVAS